MNRIISKTVMLVAMVAITIVPLAGQDAPTGWQAPPENIMKVLHAPKLPWIWTAPTGEYLFLAEANDYPTLAEMSAPMHKLAGTRINPANNGYHGDRGGTSPYIIRIDDGTKTELELPDGAEVLGVSWNVDGRRFALSVGFSDRIELWTGSVEGKISKVEGILLNPLMGSPVRWLPDQEHLLVRRIPDRGPAPEAPVIPAGPEIREGAGANARSTYELRNLLETAYDDELFDYYMTSELIVVDPEAGEMQVLAEPAIFSMVEYSPDGKYILIEYLVGPWSHEVAHWRFAREAEVWSAQGEKVAKIYSYPLADAVPIHGEIEGPRDISWRPTAPHTLFWVEALDGGDPMAEVSHRDKLMSLDAPFTGEAVEVFRAEHRILPWRNAWAEDGGLLMLTENERMRRWNYVWLLDVDEGTKRLWYDMDQSDRYNDPGRPVMRQLPNGQWVMRQNKDEIYFRGSGATKEGDRPFLDLKNLETGKTQRLFRCDPERYESFMAFAADGKSFLLRSESPVDVPNYYLATPGKKLKAAEGEATRQLKRRAVTNFEDPTPELRQIKKQMVHYEREDGVPLSFQLLLPPGYQEGTALPTVVYAYPLEYASASTAGQVRGSTRRFMSIRGSSHLFFLLQGYAVLDQTAMPMVGDPETTYNTFVSQLVDDAEAAVAKAVELGVTDPDRIGVIGHSHGGLMVANLLAHTDLFKAGIARSGSYNKTTQPFGFQSERRSLFEARDVYIQVSPTFFADQVEEPVLIIHGNDDSNPGTLTFQSEIFYEAVRGSGGTARLVLLPFEDHGYRAIESIEHVLWEQLRWFDTYLK
jgi:dipeptidyl aminopeptidase/acylaminoacyl peptidase